MIGGGIDLGRELERVTFVAPFGVRLWDPVAGRGVADRIEVTWRDARARSVSASCSPSGVFAFRHVPSFAAFEAGAGDDPFWASPPATRKFGWIEVDDPVGRFIPFGFTVDRPSRITELAREVCRLPGGVMSGSHDASPPEPTLPILPLFSASGRPTPSGMARLSAQVETTDGRPAVGAVLKITPAGESPWFGLADGRGVVTVVFPYPKPSRRLGSPPFPAQGALSGQRWDDIGIQAFWTPRVAAAHPDLCGLLAQVDESPVTLLRSEFPSMELTELTLEFGTPLDLRTDGRSVLVLDPGSPPSP